MMRRFLVVFLAATLLAAISCNRTNKAEQLAALDSAYHSGLLTKDEYDAKRLALTSTAPAPASAAPPASAPPAAPPVTPSAPPDVAGAKEPAPAPLAGCEDAEFKSGGKKGADERFFAASPEMVKRAAVSALGSLDFDIQRSSSNEIEARKERHAGAGGERVVLTFQKTQRGRQSGTRVMGQTKKSFVGRRAQKTWTDAVLAQISCKLRESSR